MLFISTRNFCCTLTIVLGSLLGGVETQSAEAAVKTNRPNILWITSEDNGAHWLGCYGNPDAKTPTLDALANDSTLFTHAYSNSPVCAVARSTILHGIYAVTSGTQHMRSRYAIPATFKPYVSYLRKQGYYCTNNNKTDFNRLGNDKNIWDACGNQAHYKNRAQAQPFFAIFNLIVTHESSLFPKRVKHYRSRGVIPAKTRLQAKTITVPAHLPELPEVRQDLARYHDYITALDNRVAKILKELAARGLKENTIVFYYSDHGGPMPRGKRYLTNTGVQVPMIVHVPEQFKHLTPFQTGERSDELVSFVDLAPTLLSLCGLKKPLQMQGRAFLGTHRVEPGDAKVLTKKAQSDSPMVFLYADRFDEVSGMRRGLTDGRYKYIRRFTSHLPAAPYCQYSLGVPSWTAWRRAWQAGKLPAAHCTIWESPQPVEELYDTTADPWEINNLAASPQQAQRLQEFRTRLQQEMLAVKDTGIIPESMFPAITKNKTLPDYVSSEQFDLNRTLQFAFLATAGEHANLPAIVAMLTNKEPACRYWAALGLAILGESATATEPQLTPLLKDPQATLRITAALALCKIGHAQQGKTALLTEFEQPLKDAETVLLLNTLYALNYQGEVPRSWIKKHYQQKAGNKTVRSFAERLNGQSNKSK